MNLIALAVTISQFYLANKAEIDGIVAEVVKLEQALVKPAAK